MIRDLMTILFGVALVAGGLAGGWWLKSEVASHAGGGDAHGHDHGGADADDHAGHDHAGHDHADHAEGPAPITAEARRALGVVLRPASLTKSVPSEEIPAVVADRPENHRIVRLPFGGVVEAVHGRTGDPVAPGAPLVTVLREAIPPFARERIAELLTPVGEEVHAAAGALREASKRREIARRERDRLTGLATEGVVRGSDLREMEYELERADQAVGNAEHELEHHGLTGEEIAAVAAGRTPPPQPILWERVLRRQGWWDEHSDALRALLPPSARDRAWVVPGLGELHAAGLLDQALVDDARETPALTTHLAEVIALLLGGTPRPTVTAWAQRGLLEATWTLRVPEPDDGPTDDDGPGFDLAAIHVRAGDRVTAGDAAVTLYRGATMWLRALPVGRQTATLTRALAENAPIDAVPLIPGTGPTFSDLRVLRIHPLGEGGSERSVADLIVPNEASGAGGGPRTWRLKSGLRYRIVVPAAPPSDAFVLPRDAIVRDAGVPTLLLADGPGFRRVPVRLLHENPRQVAVAYDGSIFPGDEIVVEGAFALSLAIQQAESGGGGGHHHHH